MLLDTSGLLSFFDRRDSWHRDAVTLYASAPIKLTHSYVFAEFVPLCQSRGLNRVRVLSFLSNFQDNRNVEIVWVDQALHRDALTLLQNRLDKAYSICDAVSFLLMRGRGIAEALTTDRHFEQEGFVRLLRP